MYNLIFMVYERMDKEVRSQLTKNSGFKNFFHWYELKILNKFKFKNFNSNFESQCS